MQQIIWEGKWEGVDIKVYVCEVGLFLRFHGFEDPDLDIYFGYQDGKWDHPDFPGLIFTDEYIEEVLN